MTKKIYTYFNDIARSLKDCIVFGPSDYESYIFSLSLILCVILLFWYFPLSQVYLYLSHIPNQMFSEAKGISRLDNIESVYIAKSMAYTVGWFLVMCLLIFIIDICIRILSAIPLMMGYFFDTTKFKAPLPFIEITIRIFKYPADIFYPFIGVIVFEFFLLSCLCAGYSALSIEIFLSLVGSVAFLIGLLFYIYNRGKLLFCLLLNFLIFFIPLSIVLWDIIIYPLLAILPLCVILFLTVIFFRIPSLWKLINTNKILSLRYLSAYSFYIIVCIVPLIWGGYYLWNFVDFMITLEYEMFVLHYITKYIPSIFHSDLGTYMFSINMYSLICNLAALLTTIALLCFYVWYIRYVTNGIKNIGSRKDLVLESRWDILYLRSFSKESVNFMNLLTDYHKKTIIVNNPSVNNDLLMRGIYLSNDNWKHYLRKYVNICTHIIIQIGNTEGVKWEIHKTMERKHVHYYIDNRGELKKMIANPEFNIDAYKSVFELINSMQYKNIIFSINKSKKLLYYSIDNEIPEYINHIKYIPLRSIPKIHLRSITTVP